MRYIFERSNAQAFPAEKVKTLLAKLPEGEGQSGRGHQDDGQKFGQILAIVLAIDDHF